MSKDVTLHYERCYYFNSIAINNMERLIKDNRFKKRVIKNSLLKKIGLKSQIVLKLYKKYIFI